MELNSLYTNDQLDLLYMCFPGIPVAQKQNKQTKRPSWEDGEWGGRGEYVYRSVCLANFKKIDRKVYEKNQTSAIALPNIARREIQLSPILWTLKLFWSYFRNTFDAPTKASEMTERSLEVRWQREHKCKPLYKWVWLLFGSPDLLCAQAVEWSLFSPLELRFLAWLLTKQKQFSFVI